MKRVVFVNLHADEFLLKPLGKFIWKQSCALKHKHFLDFLLNSSDVEVCNFINDEGFTLFNSLPKPIMWFLRKLRYLENNIVMRKNGLDGKGITIIKSSNDIRPNDIVISYCHEISTLHEIADINAFKAVSMTHFYATKEESEEVKKAKPDILFHESDLSRTSEIFQKSYSWYDGTFIVDLFAAAPRFKRIKPFAERECKVFSTGTITYRYFSEFLKIYNNPCLQLSRKQIKDHADEMKNMVACYNNDYNENTDTKKYLSSDNIIVHYYKVWYNMKNAGQQKSYFSFDMVERFNNFKMFMVGEEVVGVPGIGFVEGMACGCAYIGQTIGYYEDYGMKEGVHYIGYDGTLDDLKAKITYYQRPEHQDELERIADAGYEFAQTHFRGEEVAKELLDKLIKAQEGWKASN